ncbi:hypothetical protein [Corynebacterium vitaeruminis]|uniref:Cell division protein FtsL n=1 Tax=Corynebacterium vitaeruminis DSM 20294 TaxID=1224164 RepID=W5Y9H4_9CORY|nr:hypothetical protein [Corynebacterium vitaeruminis]AHI23183.1 hypothetical protein B843_08990 [Corynebacterium vitaeruminis DSM 20294]
MTMTQGSGRDSLRRSHVSRDYSRQSTATLDGARRIPRTNPAAPERALVPPGRRRAFQHTPGSQQRFSQRGRRIADNKKAVEPRLVKMLAGLLVFIALGVFMAMTVSGWTTSQTFQIQNLKSQESTLNNQIETLNRDLQNASSSAELARKANEMGMVVPDQPGVLAVNENGDTSEQRPASDLTRPIVDVNGQQVKATTASSDPAKTNEVTNNLNALPQTNSAPAHNGTTIAPYAAH